MSFQYLKFRVLKSRHLKYLHVNFNCLKELYVCLLQHLYLEIRLYFFLFEVAIDFKCLKDFQFECFKCYQQFGLPLVLLWLRCYEVKSHLHWFHLCFNFLFHVREESEALIVNLFVASLIVNDGIEYVSAP